MKLLLTSAGITNKSLASELKKLVKGEIKIAFIPTAANLEDGEKDWLIKNYNQCEALGAVDIVDISAIEKKIWLPRLEGANVIFVGGGQTAHLMHWMNKSGLSKILPALLKNRIYVGISAGSMILSEFDFASTSELVYGESGPKNIRGLGYIDFNVLPHLNSRYFPNLRDERIKEVVKEVDKEFYALDDESGILCVDGKIKVISEGVWKRYSKDRIIQKG